MYFCFANLRKKQFITKSERNLFFIKKQLFIFKYFFKFIKNKQKNKNNQILTVKQQEKSLNFKRASINQ